MRNWVGGAMVMLVLAISGPLSSGFLWSQAQAAEDTHDLVVAASAEASECPASPQQAVARPLQEPPGSDRFPDVAAWNAVSPVVFCSDWHGQSADPGRATGVQVLWSRQALYLRFHARYKKIYLYPNKNRQQNKLWLRDVAEVFLQPPSGGEGYKEFELSPNGDWLAVNIFSAAEGRFSKLHCDLRSRGAVDEARHAWTAELAIPMKCLTAAFDPGTSWRVNFFRIEGTKPDRFYSAWRPTNTARPNFHVPEAFGELKFAAQ